MIDSRHNLETTTPSWTSIYNVGYEGSVSDSPSAAASYMLAVPCPFLEHLSRFYTAVALRPT